MRVNAASVDSLQGAPRYDFIFLDGDHSPTVVYREISAALKILNPGTNTKVNVTYRALGGLFPIHREYWVLDHTDAWFIIASPDMTEVNLYTREPRPAQAQVDRMTKQVKDLGYAGQLEFPAQTTAKP